MCCTACGTVVEESDRFCSHCGQPLNSSGTAFRGSQSSPFPRYPLVRPWEGKKIAGVCMGISGYLGIDVSLLRVLLVVFTIYPFGAGLLFYIVCWIVIPRVPLMAVPRRLDAPLGAPPAY